MAYSEGMNTETMNLRTAAAFAKALYSTRAFRGEMDGYSADELVEWTGFVMEEFMDGTLTWDDMDRDFT